MKNQIQSRSKCLLFSGVMAMLAVATFRCDAYIAGPYTPDSFTLHLWHLDETTVPCVDSVATGGTNLVDLATGATLGNASYSSGTNSFGNALNTAAGGAVKGDLLAASPTAGNVTITLADPVTGAFTFEALVQIQFDPTTNSTAAYEIMAGESGVNANRIFQWRIAPKGFTLIAGISATNSPFMTFENVRAVSGNQNTIYAPIPTTGPDAIVQGGWYHVAVTYNGQPSTPNNLIFYWTAMNPANTSDDALTINSAVTQLTGLNPLSTVTTTFMLGNQGRSKNGNFLGSIDEVRISKVARGPSGMMFALASVAVTPIANQFVPAGSTVTLNSLASGGGPIGYQWQFNGTNITGATFTNASGYNSQTLTITNITFAQAGTYTFVATNAASSNSASGVVTVGTSVAGLFNTGVNASHALLSGGSVDPNWQLVQSADPAFPGPNAIVDSAIPGTYLANGPNSQWIAPVDSAGNAGGNYEYQTVFVLDSQNLTNMQLTVNWAADNFCTDILLNGVDLGIVDNNGFAVLAPTIITTNFVQGSNTLVCVVSNSPGGGLNLTAFRAELSGLSAPLAPQPVQVLYAPTSTTVYQYQSATFVATAFGSGPLSYQWYFGPNPISGQTNRTLLLNNVDPSQAGSYTVVITNSISSTNASATLTVTAPDTLEWLGITTADWDVSTTNWLDQTSLSNVAFSENANVLFDNNGSGQPVVSLDLPLTPNSVTVGANNSYTFSGGGFLTGNFNLVLNGPGALIMDTANTYSGNTIIQGGTLQVGNNDANGSLGTSSISNNAALVFTRSDVVTVPNQITGTGSLTMSGTGTLILTGNNPGFTGPVSVANGILTPRSPTALGAGSTAATVLDGAQIFIDQNYNFPSQPFILGGTGNNGAGALHKGGAGTSILGGPITLTDYAGIALDGGSSLLITNPAAITSTNVNLAIQCGTGATCTISGAVNLGSGNVTEFGSGTIILSSLNNNWTGGTTINSSCVLQVGDGGSDGSIGNATISDGGTLTFLTANSFIMTAPVAGGGIFNQSGTGRMVLSGNPLSGFSGNINIKGNGQLQLTNGDSLTSGTLTIGATQTDTGRLELTGNNVVSAAIAIFPRAFGVNNNPANLINPANIDNLGGTNTVSPPSPVIIPGGGNLLTLQSDAGYLIFNTGITAAGVGRDFVLQGASSGEVDGPITQNAGASVNVYMLGPGAWSLNSASSSYTGTTIVSNGTLVVNGVIASSPVTVAHGTLGGIGTLTGPVVIASGATLAPTLATGPATPIGTLTVSNSLSLQAGSFTTFQLNESAGTNDQITGLSSVSYGGTLSLSNLAGTFTLGDTFHLFNSTSYGGSFASIIPASPGTGLRWNPGSLAVDGTLRVASTNVTRPTISSVAAVGGNLVFSGSGGQMYGSFVLLSSTNAAAPLATWTRVSTNLFDASGHYTITKLIGSAPAAFFTLQAQ